MFFKNILGCVDQISRERMMKILMTLILCFDDMMIEYTDGLER